MTLDEVKEVLVKAKTAKTHYFKEALTCSNADFENTLAKAEAFSQIEIFSQLLLVRMSRTQ